MCVCVPVVCVCVWASWVSVLQNSKEEALSAALGGEQGQDSLQELSRSVITQLPSLPGNQACADCGAPGEPTTNPDPDPVT